MTSFANPKSNGQFHKNSRGFFSARLALTHIWTALKHVGKTYYKPENCIIKDSKLIPVDSKTCFAQNGRMSSWIFEKKYRNFFYCLNRRISPGCMIEVLEFPP